MERSEVRDAVRQTINSWLKESQRDGGRVVFAGDNIVEPLIEAAQLPIAPITPSEAAQLSQKYGWSVQTTTELVEGFISRRNNPPKCDPLENIKFIFGDCSECGASVTDTGEAKHIEWHKRLAALDAMGKESQ
jgi:hypothetical protein